MNNGYIRLHRKFLEWEWLQNPNDVSLFIHLLLMTNWKDSKYKDIDVPRGSLVTGRKELSKKVGVTEQQIRTSLNHLKSTNVITTKSYSKFSIISINNYDKYQVVNQEDNQQPTSNKPATNQQVTTYEESNKEINKKEEIYKEEKNIYFQDKKLNNKFLEFLKIRKSMNISNDDDSLKNVLSKLETYSDEVKIEMLENSIKNKWELVYKPKTKKNNIDLDEKFNGRPIGQDKEGLDEIKKILEEFK